MIENISHLQDEDQLGLVFIFAAGLHQRGRKTPKLKVILKTVFKTKGVFQVK